MIKLTHGDLIKVGALLGYNSFTNGVCHGFSFMWGQALLAQDEECFFKRLELIAFYNPNFEDLITEIEKANKKAHQPSELTQQEIDLLDIPAFFDGIEMYLNTEKHSDLLDKKNVHQHDINTIYPFIKPKKMEDSELSILFNKSHIYSKASLTAFLQDLEGQLKEADSELPLLLDSSDHSVGLKYSKTKQKWFYIDTNDFEQYPDTTTYFRELETTELVSSLFESLSDSSAANVLFNLKVLSTTRQTQLDSMKASLALLDSRYPVTRELAIACDSHKLGLLFVASQQGDLNLIQKLLEHPEIEINQINREEATPFYMACQNGQLAIVTELLKHPKIKINQAKSDGVTPLYIACQNGHLHVVAELLKQPKIKINQAKSNGATPLYNACDNGHLHVVAELLKQPKIKINQADSEGTTPLYIACQEGHLDVVTELLKHPKIEINQAKSNGVTSLYIACQEGHLDVVIELLKHPKIEINQAKNNGVTPLHMACQEGHLAITELLLNTPGIDINSQDLANHTPLLFACSSPYTQNNEKLFQLLLNKETNLSHKNANGQTALDIAFMQNNTAALSVLLKAIPHQSMSPSALMSSFFLKKALRWANAQCPEVAEYLTTYQSTGHTIKFFTDPAKTESLKDESSSPRNKGGLHCVHK